MDKGVEHERGSQIDYILRAPLGISQNHELLTGFVASLDYGLFD